MKENEQSVEKARLDYFLIYETCLEYVLDTNINPG